MKKRVNFCLIALFAIIIILTLIVNLIVVSAPETGSPATSGSLNYWVTCGCPNADRDGFCPV
jgi:hypothetical protein